MINVNSNLLKHSLLNAKVSKLPTCKNVEMLSLPKFKLSITYLKKLLYLLTIKLSKLLVFLKTDMINSHNQFS